MGAEVKIRWATPEDARFIAAHMRPADRDEILAWPGWDALEALTTGLDESAVCFAATFDGVPLAMLGVVPESPVGEIGTPWLLTAEGIEKFPVAILKGARQVVKQLLAYYPTLYGVVDARYTGAVALLKHLGFNVEETPRFERKGISFLFYSMESD